MKEDFKEIKVGVIGVGRMGEHHLRKYLQLADYNVTVAGIYDANTDHAQAKACEHGVRAFSQLAELLFEVDAVTIASPTDTHFAVTKQAIEAGVHVLIEKPVSDSPEAAAKLAALAKSKGVVAQVGLVERFRFLELAGQLPLKPVRFIETQRLSTTLPREKNIDVIGDLMIHDLDLVLSLVGEEPSHVSAIGVNVLTDYVDMANVRLEFPSGAVANLNASRVSKEGVRKLRIYSLSAYASMDFMNNTVKVHHRDAANMIRSQESCVEKLDALLDQCEHFIHCVRNGAEPIVTLDDGYRALKYSQIIKDKVRERATCNESSKSAQPTPIIAQLPPQDWN